MKCCYIKMTQKFSGNDYAVCKLEGLWWGREQQADFIDAPPDAWNWKLLIRTPDFITERHLCEAISALQKKGKSAPVGEVKLEKINEGLCVQMLLLGPYREESETIAQMKEFAEREGVGIHGLHHE